MTTIDQPTSPHLLRRICRKTALPLTLVASALLIVAVGSLVLFGTPRRALAFWRGDVVTVRRIDGQLMGISPGEAVRVVCELENLSDQRVTILGAKSMCGCGDAVRKLPLTLASGEVGEFEVEFVPPATDQGCEFQMVYVLYLDVKSRPAHVRIVGKMAENEDPGDSVGCGCVEGKASRGKRPLLNWARAWWG
jgi:hypothetical protein